MRVDRLQREFAVEVEWLPFELHPEIPPEGVPMVELTSRGRFRDEYFDRLRWLAQDSGIDMKQPSLIPNSRLALESAEFARDAGLFDRFHRALFAAYFERNENIGDEQVLCRVGEECGVDGEALLETLGARRYSERVDASTERARDRGIGGTPTFIFDDRFELVGAQDFTVFESIAEKMGAPRVAGD